MADELEMGANGGFRFCGESVSPKYGGKFLWAVTEFVPSFFQHAA
jgi:hypothetical protein